MVQTIAPLLIQLAKVFNVPGVGRPNFAEPPSVWLINVLNELILWQNCVLQWR